jgi:hypothetical protein
MKLSAAIILGVLASATAAQAFDGSKNAAWHRIIDDAVRMKWQFSRDCCPKDQPRYCTLTLMSPTEDNLMLCIAARAHRPHGRSALFFGVYW